jgi:hypothetical protein
VVAVQQLSTRTLPVERPLARRIPARVIMTPARASRTSLVDRSVARGVGSASLLADTDDLRCFRSMLYVVWARCCYCYSFKYSSMTNDRIPQYCPMNHFATSPQSPLSLRKIPKWIQRYQLDNIPTAASSHGVRLFGRFIVVVIISRS